MLTISLVEDDDDYRELLRRSISSTKELRLVSAYATGEEALKRLPREKPTVALVDIKLPAMDGIECVRRLRLVDPPLATHFMMLTGHEDNNLIFDSLRAGAHGYLLKDQTTANKLVTAIKEVAAGGAPITPIIARKIIAHFEGHSAPVSSLSNREHDVLRRLADGLMYKEIAIDLLISMNTVRKHVGAIYDKLHVRSRTAAALQFAHNVRFSPPPDHPKT